jgi:hypothetical protein
LIVEHPLVLELPAPAAAPRGIRGSDQGRDDRNSGAALVLCKIVIVIAIVIAEMMMIAIILVIASVILAADAAFVAIAFVFVIVRHNRIIHNTPKQSVSPELASLFNAPHKSSSGNK